METLSNPKEFALAGNATITLESENTGKHFTYKIAQCDDNDNLYFIKLLCNCDNDADYTYIGCYYKDSNYLHLKEPYRGRDEMYLPPSIRAIRFFFKNIDKIPPKLHVYHEGRCGRCGRKLTTPESIKSGFGPECMKLR